MSMDKLVEEIIRAAMARGDFDNLPGEGKPQNLDDYFAMPEDLRMAFSVLKSNGFVPAEVDLLKEVAVLREQLESTTDQGELAQLRKRIDEKMLAFNLLLEQRRSHRRRR